MEPEVQWCWFQALWSPLKLKCSPKFETCTFTIFHLRILDCRHPSKWFPDSCHKAVCDRTWRLNLTLPIPRMRCTCSVSFLRLCSEVFFFLSLRNMLFLGGGSNCGLFPSRGRDAWNSVWGRGTTISYSCIMFSTFGFARKSWWERPLSICRNPTASCNQLKVGTTWLIPFHSKVPDSWLSCDLWFCLIL